MLTVDACSYPDERPDFERLPGIRSSTNAAIQYAESQLDSHMLHDPEHSLIGQLSPGLRLCLAAEVTTGLICDRCVQIVTQAW
jgi:hypothetical protein